MLLDRVRRACGACLATLSIALAAGAAYYVGSLAGLVLRLPPGTPSVIWPPNAILTAALLLTAPRRWLIIVLAAFPAHLAAQLPTDWPFSMVVALFGSNAAEAVIAAALVRLLNDQPTRFDTVHRFAGFLCGAVFAAPVLTTFTDAAAVALFRADSYWQVWTSRLPSNVLAQLIVTPTVVGLVARGRGWFRTMTFWRCVEAAALGACLVGASGLALAPKGQGGLLLGVLVDEWLVVQLPLLLWGALRFGPSGASLALLCSTCTAAWVSVHALSSSPLPPDRLILTIQTFFITVGVTMLGVATVIEERRQAVQGMAERLRVEKLLSEFSRSFVQLASEQLEVVSRDWLRRIGTVLNLDCVCLLRLEPDDPASSVACEWRRAGVPAASASSISLARDCPWMFERLQGRNPIMVPNLDALPAAALRDRVSLQRQGYHAALVLPLLDRQRLIGALGFATFAERTWADELVTNLHLFCEVLANALVRRQTEDALRRAQLDAQRSRQELAHVARVSTMGELTASLAHQLNQPLTGVMSNAQAARQLLRREQVDAAELRAIMSDIADDARRASEVIQRVRELLRNGEFEMKPVEVSAAVREVVNLLRSDALIRNVAIHLQVGVQPIHVLGDRVQLQQVVLNLIVNSMEAMTDDAWERVVFVSCDRPTSRDLRVTVRDSGAGLAEGTEHLVFEPFYTTKGHGMGMGLSIARSIVEAHGGTIRASNVEPRGMLVEFTLPVVEPAAAGSLPGGEAGQALAHGLDL